MRRSDARHDPNRTLFVRLPDSMRLCVATTGDFDDAELRRIKDVYGQIYADVSSKIAPDDFEADLRKLRLGSECRECEARVRCGGCFHANATNVFSRDRSDVERILNGLSGRILDIGCGSGDYVGALRDGALDGTVEYWGLDPDASRVAVLGSRHAWARYFVGTVQALRTEQGVPAVFQHILLLRSYNHLENPADTLDVAASLLETGGTLLIVDNVPFGLVRTEAHGARAESGPALFEHYRNEDAEGATRFVSASNFRLLDRRDVSPSGSNEWLLHYEKISSS